MKRIILAALLGVTTITVASTASAGQDRVSVCHHGDDGIELISIADPALDAHIAHGDAQPGDEIAPSDEHPYGAAWGDDCSVIPNDPPLPDLRTACESAFGGAFTYIEDPLGDRAICQYEGEPLGGYGDVNAVFNEFQWGDWGVACRELGGYALSAARFDLTAITGYCFNISSAD